MKLIILGLCIALASAEIFYQETFDSSWEDRWVNSGSGKFERSHGEFFADAEKDFGLKTAQDAKFYAISSGAAAAFDNKDKDLVLQFSVKHEQKIDCGGGYIKLMPDGLDQENFNGDSQYSIMFGPDICGTSTKRVHVIFNYKGENHLTTKTIQCETDTLTHVYTLIVHPDNTYEVRIDGNKKADGSLFEDWDMLPAKMIKDPDQSKPTDWVDEAMIDDPEDVKPAGWDDIAEYIEDPDASKPDDWDDDMDGEWEAPEIDNPEYSGEWKAKRIPNPEYKGKWVHPEIDNPEYVEDNELYLFENMKYVGFDLWQVKAGTIFDNIIVTDDIKEAEAFMAETFDHEAEKTMMDEQAEALRKAQEEEDDDDDDDDEDDSDEDDSDDENQKDEL